MPTLKRRDNYVISNLLYTSLGEVARNISGPEITYQDLKEVSDFLKKEYSIKNPNYGRYVEGRLDGRERLVYVHIDEKETTNPATKVVLPRNCKEVPEDWTLITESVTYSDITDFKFDGSLRDYQEDFFKNNPGLFADFDRVLVAPCGSGKTVMSLFIAAKTKQKTVVVVPTNFLADQYEKRANEFLTGARIYRHISSKPINPDTIANDIDIFIATYDSLLSSSGKNVANALSQYYGHWIVDEGHRIGAQSYIELVKYMFGAYRTLITATYRREDDMIKVISDHFGNQYEMENVNPPSRVIAWKTGIDVGIVIPHKKVRREDMDVLDKYGEDLGFEWCVHQGYIEFPIDMKLGIVKGNLTKLKFNSSVRKKDIAMLERLIDMFEYNTREPSYATLDSYVATLEERVELFVEKVSDLVIEEERKVLVLSKRKDVLYEFEKKLTMNGVSAFVLTAQENKVLQKQENYEEALTKYDVILGIDKIAKEGMDVPWLDTLVLFHPLGDIQQAVGRIERIGEDKQSPLTLYPVGENFAYDRLWKKAQRLSTNINIEDHE